MPLLGVHYALSVNDDVDRSALIVFRPLQPRSGAQRSASIIGGLSGGLAVLVRLQSLCADVLKMGFFQMLAVTYDPPFCAFRPRLGHNQRS